MSSLQTQPKQPSVVTSAVYVLCPTYLYVSEVDADYRFLVPIVLKNGTKATADVLTRSDSPVYIATLVRERLGLFIDWDCELVQVPMQKVWEVDF